ncbi:hypothetical protein B0H16DRAFT_1738727 [Mycena metata]|uniref:Uncharacterized protein n=1 Tax=Mycena metata TaxID=1033252 RepID=A0AAD7HI74_9AGAR|nr:hypothetical protein B0H16DRAFT_1738727 [Mycena metata]
MPSSNVEADDQSWLAFGWPVNYRFPDALGLPGEEDPVETYQSVPRTQAGLNEWAFIARNKAERDHTRGLLLLYRNPPPLPIAPGASRGVICPVGIRVQGFIERSNLGPLGNWASGKPAQGATQFIVLSGGLHHADVFRQYKRTVQEVVKFIHRTLDSPVPEPASRDEQDMLFIGRRVFAKVNSGNRRRPTALVAGDDPRGLCQEIDHEWRVLNKLKIGSYIPNDDDPGSGHSVPSDALNIHDGDFVDVCVGFDIVSKPAHNGGHNVKVHLNMEHVLLLVSALDELPPIADEDSADAVPVYRLPCPELSRLYPMNTIYASHLVGSSYVSLFG